MALNDIYEMEAVFEVNGQFGTNVQHFRCDGIGSSANEQQLSQQLADKMTNAINLWQLAASDEATYVGCIVQVISPVRGPQYAFVENAAGTIVDPPYPANCAVLVRKMPFQRGRAGVGHMFLMGIGKASVTNGRVAGVDWQKWSAYAANFVGTFEPTIGDSVFVNGVWSRSQETFNTTSRIEVLSTLRKLRSRTPQGLLGA